MTMRASLIITAKEQASAALGKVAAGARAVSAAFKPVQREAAVADRAIGSVGNGAPGQFGRIGQAARAMAGSFRPVQGEARAVDRALDAVGEGTAGRFARIGASARRMAGDLRLAERAGYGIGTAIGWSIRKTAGLAASTVKWGAIGLAGSAAYAAGSFMGGIIPTASQFEQFQAQLEGTEGSVQKAKAAMDWVARFAAQTPYQIDQVTDAFVRARGVGIDPLTGAMTKMGDAAAANRKTLMDAVEAIADAQTGEFERLKAFNITTSVKGDKVSFAYIDKAGKNAVKTAKKNATEIQKAILGIWDDRHGGAMIRQSKTFAGLWANLVDWVTLFQLKIAQAGIFDRLKNGLANVLDYVNRRADSGKLDVWAKQISDWLSKIVDKGSQFTAQDYEKVGTNLLRIAKAVWATALGFAKIVEYASAVPWVLDKITSEPLVRVTKEPRFEGPKSVPGLLGSAAKGRPAKPEEQAPWWQLGRIRRDSAPKNPAPAPPKAPAKTARSVEVQAPARTATPFRPATKAVTPWTPRTSGTSAARQIAGVKQIVQTQRVVNDVKVGGGVEVSVRAAPGLIASTTRLSSNNRNVPLTAKTGKAMAEAA